MSVVSKKLTWLHGSDNRVQVESIESLTPARQLDLVAPFDEKKHRWLMGRVLDTKYRQYHLVIPGLTISFKARMVSVLVVAKDIFGGPPELKFTLWVDPETRVIKEVGKR